jgi:short-subunit dehydrogenase
MEKKMNKTLLIIGSGPGIGLATAERFAREGYSIVLASRSIANLQRQAQRLSAMGARVTLIEADASKPPQIHDLILRIAELGPFTLLYNAGVLRYDDSGQLRPLPLAKHSVAELQSDMTINLTSALVAVRTAASVMGEHGQGVIMLTGGGFGIDPAPDFLPISVGKAGIRAIARAMFAPLKEQGIHIGTVTVSRLVAADSDASREVADAFWDLAAAAPEQWTWETTVA